MTIICAGLPSIYAFHDNALLLNVSVEIKNINRLRLETTHFNQSISRTSLIQKQNVKKCHIHCHSQRRGYVDVRLCLRNVGAVRLGSGAVWERSRCVRDAGSQPAIRIFGIYYIRNCWFFTYMTIIICM